MASATSTQLGRDVRDRIPGPNEVPGYLFVSERDAAIWDRAVHHLNVRNNDSHTLYAYGIAQALLARLPQAREDVVLPAILMHDTGWSTVADEEILEAIAPGGGRPDLVLLHEKNGAAIARGILEELGLDDEIIAHVVAIIDGHDSRKTETISLEDAIVKDADKLWRLSPHGIHTVMGWFALSHDEALRLCCARVEDSLFTEVGKAIARAFAAIASIDQLPQRQLLV